MVQAFSPAAEESRRDARTTNSAEKRRMAGRPTVVAAIRQVRMSLFARKVDSCRSPAVLYLRLRQA